MSRRLTAFLLGLLASSSCTKDSIREGGLYATPQEDGSFAIFKVLKTDAGGVHLRLYTNRYPEKPVSIVEPELYMAGIDHKPTEELGLGHAPISWKSFEAWKAEFVQQSSVAEEELEGYSAWSEAKAGYF